MPRNGYRKGQGNEQGKEHDTFYFAYVWGQRTTMQITIRDIGPDDAEAFFRVHHAAVRGIAAKDYPPEVIENWAPRIDDAALAKFLANPDGEHRVIAETSGTAVGIGSIVVAKCELRACYVAPDAARQGVGSEIVRQLEELARQHNLPFLQLVSSITAEAFYESLGYLSLGRDQHTLSSGVPMACVKMRKEL